MSRVEFHVDVRVRKQISAPRVAGEVRGAVDRPKGERRRLSTSGRRVTRFIRTYMHVSRVYVPTTRAPGIGFSVTDHRRRVNVTSDRVRHPCARARCYTQENNNDTSLLVRRAHLRAIRNSIPAITSAELSVYNFIYYVMRKALEEL